MGLVGLLAVGVTLAGCGVKTSAPPPTQGSAGTSGGSGTSGGGSGTSGGSGTGGGTSGTSGGASGTGGGASGTGGGAGTSGAGGTSGAAGTTPTPTDGGTGTDAGKPLSGITVTINGTAIPKEKVIVFIHIGHSNMAGRAVDPADLHAFNFTTDPHLWSYAKGGTFKPAIEPLSPDSKTGTGAGPGMSILKTALAKAPDLYMVSIGKGESGDFGGYCTSFRKGGLFYKSAMDAAMELKGKVTFGGIWVMLGTSEFADQPHATTFGTCLQGVITDMRTDLGDATIPAAIGDWEMGSTGKFLPTTAFAVSIISQIHSATAAVPPSVLIPTDGDPMQDPDADGEGGLHHFNMAGHKMWAEHGFDLLTKAGLTPWAP
jgi:Carbohydrate esterase, sialic acid-specific acetylesterase